MVRFNERQNFTQLRVCTTVSGIGSKALPPSSKIDRNGYSLFQVGTATMFRYARSRNCKNAVAFVHVSRIADVHVRNPRVCARFVIL